MEEIITSVCVKAAKYTNNWKGRYPQFEKSQFGL